ncbi:MAG TPA: Hsp20/alpha crystallin family protein, partial [Phototrophicaceae bacterium]|nr:Hsp20/alpha crystallin family protein [Phototrophicaceae bacterium]
MSTLIRYEDPFNSMVRSMQNLMDQNRSWFNDSDLSLMGSNLAVDVTADEKQITVKTAIPGVKEEDIKLDVSGKVLTISAETKNDHEDQQPNWYIREMRYGKYSRTIQLPDDVKGDKAEATLENGILT